MKIRYSLILVLAFQAMFSFLTVEAKNRPSEQSFVEQSPLNRSSQQLSVIQWQQDADKLLTSIRNFHPNPWRSISENTFKTHLEQIVSASQSNTRAQTMISLIAAVSMITQAGGDGHTRLSPFQQATQFNLFPLRFYTFSDGVYITETDDNNQSLVGQKINTIAGVSIEKVFEKVTAYISNESPNSIKSLTPSYSIISELLAALNISKGNEINIVTQSSVGKLITTKLHAISLERYKAMFRHALDSPLLPVNESSAPYLRKVVSEKYWYQISDDKTLYLQYNTVNEENNGQSFSDFIAEIEIEIKKQQVESLIVDVRSNSGGKYDYKNSHRIYAPFFDMMNHFNAEQREVSIYALIGRATISIAANFIFEMDKKTQAVFIGEAMGGSSSYYGEPERITLPNSKLKVIIATRYRTTAGIANPDINAIPDYLIELSAEQYFSKSDPVLIKALELIELNSFD